MLGGVVVSFFLGKTAGGVDFFFGGGDVGVVGEPCFVSSVIFFSPCFEGFFFSLSDPLRLPLPDVVFLVLLLTVGEGEMDDDDDDDDKEFFDELSLVVVLFTDDDDERSDDVVFRVSDFVVV